MRKEWYIAQAYSGMENKVKEVIEEKAKMLGLSSLFGRVIVPEIEEIDYANRKVDRVFISNEAELYTKASKYVKKGDILAKEPSIYCKKTGAVTEVKNYRRIIVETVDKKYSKTFVIPESAGIIAGLRTGRDIKSGMPFAKSAAYECDVDGEIGSIEKVKRVVIQSSLNDEEVYVIPVKLFDSKTLRIGAKIDSGKKLANGSEYAAKSSGRVDIKEHLMRKEIKIIKTNKSKLFPGYVFIEMIYTQESENLIKTVPYISTLLNVGGKPIKLTLKEAKALLKLVGQELVEQKKLPKVRMDYTIGEQIKIINGPFELFTGKITRINLEKQEVKVTITLFGRETTVELSLAEIEKIE
jgi:transcriptional antiterminator NusG